MQSREAIESLLELSAADSFSREAINELDAIALPSNMTVHDLEVFHEAPKRQRLSFVTPRIPQFTDYVNAEANLQETAVFIDPNGDGATAVIDFGTSSDPMWKRHKAVLKMHRTTEFRVLENMTEMPLSQRDLTDWIEDFTEIITAVGNGQVIKLAHAVGLIRRIDVKTRQQETHQDGDFQQSRSAMEEIEAVSADMKFPEIFRVRCKPYPDLKEREISVRLSLRTGDGKPKFMLRVIARDALMDSIRDEIEEILRDDLEDMRVFTGNI